MLQNSDCDERNSFENGNLSIKSKLTKEHYLKPTDKKELS
jgi:hypothetical protein